MLQRDFEALLVAAKLAYIRAGKFHILPHEWDSFITGGHFVFLDGDKPQWIPPKRVDISALANGSTAQMSNKHYIYCVRIGTVNESTPDNLLDQKEERHKGKAAADTSANERHTIATA